MERERRSAHRLRLAVPVLVESREGIWRCIARDLSARGIFVETRRIAPPGTSLRVTFSVPGGPCEMTARCTVRHVVRLDAPDGALHGMGLSIENFEDDADEESDDAVSARRLHA